jgi:hypothetical protein
VALPSKKTPGQVASRRNLASGVPMAEKKLVGKKTSGDEKQISGRAEKFFFFAYIT